ncbi:MAG: protein kinase [Planctomycetes bacterium]|nr:protein kinase [Planctomycetota bacterium]
MKLDGYQLEGEIARGAMGVVYRALELQSERRVAIKLLLDTSERFRVRFQREGEALAKLRHPNVVAVHSVGESEGHPYLVMEFVEGVSLEERVRRGGPLEPREAARLIAALARGAGHAHSVGLVHRDIKPANAILRPCGTVLLADFGLARDLDVASDLSKTGMFIGTPGFASPEQAAGEGKRVTPASDVYGLGAALFALLTGGPPVVGTLVEVLIATIRGPTPSVRAAAPAVDRSLDAICLRAMAKDPAERYADGDALADALEGYLREGVTQRQTSGRRAVYALLGVLFLAGVGLAAFVPVESREKEQAVSSVSPVLGSSRAVAPSARPLGLDPDLARTLRLVAGKTGQDQLDAAIEILSEGLGRAGPSTNRAEAERHLARLYARRAESLFGRDMNLISADLRGAAALDPTDARRRALAESLTREGLLLANRGGGKSAWPRVRAFLEEASSLCPDDPRPVLALARQARLHNELETALSAFEEASRREPSSGEACAGQADVLATLGRVAEGIRRLESFLKLHGEDRERWRYLGDLWRDRGRWVQARAAYERAGGAEDGSAACLLGLSWVAFAEGRLSLALRLLERSDPRLLRREAREVDGLANQQLGNHLRAGRVLKRAFVDTPLSPRVALSYLRSLRALGRQMQARKRLAALLASRRLSRLDGDVVEGLELASTGEHARAAQVLQRTLVSVGKERRRWPAIQLARHFLTWGRYHRPELAYSLAQIAIKADPNDDDVEALALAAYAQLRRGHVKEAEALVNAALVRNPNHVESHQVHADWAVTTQRYEVAIAASRRCLELEPTAAYAAVFGAEGCIGAGRFQDADPFLELMNDRIKNNAIPPSLRAIVRVERGDLKGAAADVKRALGDRRPRVRVARAALWIAQGKFAEGRALAEPLAALPEASWTRLHARRLLARLKEKGH